MKKHNQILAAALTGLLAWSAQAADVVGKWLGEFDTPVGHQKYAFSFQTEGDKLTAKADAELDGEKRKVEFTEVKFVNETVSFVEMLKFQENDIRIEYTGKAGAGEIQFSRKVGDFATEEFVAKRSDTASPTNVVAAPATDISGQWHADVDTQIGLQKYVYTFHVEGGKLTGKANVEVNDNKREAELLEGKISGAAVSFVEMLKLQDNDLRIEYTGKIGPDGIRFTRKVGDFATEVFVAKRSAPPTPPATAVSTNSP